MILPTIISISVDSLQAVPPTYREGSIALGATRWQTAEMVLFPAARSGIIASIILGMGRAVGETMAVIMIAGNAAERPPLAPRPGQDPDLEHRPGDGLCGRRTPAGPLRDRRHSLRHHHDPEHDRQRDVVPERGPEHERSTPEAEQAIVRAVLWILTVITVFILFFIVIFILRKGLPVLELEFLTGIPWTWAGGRHLLDHRRDVALTAWPSSSPLRSASGRRST